MRRGIMLAVVAACSSSAPSTKGKAMSNPLLESGAHRVPVNGVDISFEVRGKGPVCIAHPGGPGIDATYMRDGAFERRFTMVYLDPIGTGSSGKLPLTEKYSMTRDVDVLEAVRAKLGIDRVCLVGHSYGGMVILRYAVAHPTHVQGLFLYSTSPTTEDDWRANVASNLSSWFKDQPWFADAMKGFDDEDKATNEAELTAAGVLQWPAFFADWSGHRSEYASLISQLKVTFEVERRREPTKYDVRQQLGVIHTTPTVIVSGDKDFICGLVPSHWIEQAIAGSKLVTIERAGHFAHIEQPAAFDRAVDTFAGLLR